MGKKFILSIDLGTTGNRVFCFDEQSAIISSAYREFTQHFPKPGWVEHDPREIWQNIVSLIPEAMVKGGLDGKDCLAIGITNQRETTVLWERSTGKPVYNAIVWQCRRTMDICNRMKDAGHEKVFRDKTGLMLDAYFSGTKITWILENVKGTAEAARDGLLAFGTIDTWILWNLTGGKTHLTDFTNASRTLLYNIKKKTWDDELCSLLSIPQSLLPEVQDSASLFGTTKNIPGLPDGIPIHGIAGDQQAAMVGQNCVTPGTSKNTYGTGCFMLLHNGDQYIVSENGLLTTMACDEKGKPSYALEGSVFIGGAVMQWLRDFMSFYNNASETERMVSSIPDEDDVVLVPAFTGLGAPHWQMDARGAIFGLTRDTSKEQLTRAALKSIAHQSMDVLHAMEEDTGKKIEELRVDGGATANEYLMQYQSNILSIPVALPAITESTALGASYLAGVSLGLYKTIDEIASYNVISKIYSPSMEKDERVRERRKWLIAVKRLTTQIQLED